MPVLRMKAKFAIVGNSGVGKTSLIRRFVLDEYDDKYLHTVGTKVTKVKLTIPHGAGTEVDMDVSIFDIMGQKGFRDMVKDTYFHDMQGLLAVCDVTNRQSLDDLQDWIATALESGGGAARLHPREQARPSGQGRLRGRGAHEGRPAVERPLRVHERQDRGERGRHVQRARDRGREQRDAAPPRGRGVLRG